jgi:hypothetical protein
MMAIDRRLHSAGTMTRRPTAALNDGSIFVDVADLNMNRWARRRSSSQCNRAVSSPAANEHDGQHQGARPAHGPMMPESAKLSIHTMEWRE